VKSTGGMRNAQNSDSKISRAESTQKLRWMIITSLEQQNVKVRDEVLHETAQRLSGHNNTSYKGLR
jgi:uncharacterized protein YdcH (DUF465 family)